MTSVAAVLSKVTVKVPVLFASLTVSFAMLTVGSSSSVITRFKSASSSAMIALVALESVNVPVSVTSLEESVVMGMATVPVVSPAEMVSVPVVPV